MKDLSSAALRMLYLNCIRISESAGTSNAASNIIAVAVDKAGLGDNYFIEEVREMPQGLGAILAALNARVEAHVEHSALYDLYDEYRSVRSALSQRGVVAYCPYVFSFE